MSGTLIRLHEHPFSGDPPREIRVPSLGEWLLQHYGPAPKVGVQVFVGEPSAASEISRDARALAAGDAPVYTVLQSPGVDPATWATIVAYAKTAWSYIQVAAAVYSVYSALTAGRNSASALANRTSASANNSLGQRENRLRYLERIEDIYGRVRSIPSLMAPAYRKYINHKLVEHGYYCIGRGWHDITDVRDGDTLVSEIPGASAAFYQPFTSPNSGHAPQLLIGDPIIDDIVSVRRSVEVDGIALPAQNQVQLAASDTYTFVADPAGDIIQQANKQPNFNAVAEPGDLLDVVLAPVSTAIGAGAPSLVVDAASSSILYSGTAGLFDALVAGEPVVVAGFANAANNGTFTVAAVGTHGVQLSGGTFVDEAANPSATLTYTRDYSGTYEIASVGDGDVQLTTSVWPSSSAPIVSSVQLHDRDHKASWVTIPTADRTQVWCNVVARQGMFRDGGGGKGLTEASYTIEIEQLDPDDLTPTGTVETVTSTLSGKTSDERAETIEHVTAWTGPCRVRVYRSSQYDYAFNGTIIDELTWTDVYGVTPVTQTHFGNLTTVHTVTPANSRATAARTRQLRCLATRRIPTWNGSGWTGAFAADGSIASGTIGGSTRMIDILAAVITDPLIGNRSISELDVAQVWAVQQQLDALHADAGQFSYTFDSDSMSLEETISIIADACFCRAYRQNGLIRMGLDRRQSSSSMLFTHRNKQPRSETLTRTFAHLAEHDGVEFVYVDPISEQNETIRLPLDGSARRPRRFELPGIRSFPQAWLRANREYRKLLGQRMAIETGCLGDARMLLPMQRIDIVDNTRFKSFDGEVIAQDGLTLRLSQAVEFTPGADHSIVLMKRDGGIQSIACTAGADANHVVLQSLPAEAIVTTHGPDGVRTIYSFAADTARGAMAYIVQEVEPSSTAGSVTVRAIGYRDDYYAADLEVIPERAGVINA